MLLPQAERSGYIDVVTTDSKVVSCLITDLEPWRESHVERSTEVARIDLLHMITGKRPPSNTAAIFVQEQLIKECYNGSVTKDTRVGLFKAAKAAFCLNTNSEEALDFLNTSFLQEVVICVVRADGNQFYPSFAEMQAVLSPETAPGYIKVGLHPEPGQLKNNFMLTFTSPGDASTCLQSLRIRDKDVTTIQVRVLPYVLANCLYLAGFADEGDRALQSSVMPAKVGRLGQSSEILHCVLLNAFKIWPTLKLPKRTEICLAVVNANVIGMLTYHNRGGKGGFLGAAKPQNRSERYGAKRPPCSELQPGSWHEVFQRVWFFYSLDGIPWARKNHGVKVIVLEVTDMSNSTAAASSSTAESTPPMCLVFASQKPNGYYIKITRSGVNSALAGLPGWPFKELFSEKKQTGEKKEGKSSDANFEFRITNEDGRWYLGSDTLKTTLTLAQAAHFRVLHIATLDRHSAPMYPPRLG